MRKAGFVRKSERDFSLFVFAVRYRTVDPMRTASKCSCSAGTTRARSRAHKQIVGDGRRLADACKREPGEEPMIFGIDDEGRRERQFVEFTRYHADLSFLHARAAVSPYDPGQCFRGTTNGALWVLANAAMDDVPSVL